MIFGLQGSGKTILAKHILRQAKSHLVYDPLDEYSAFTRYVPQDRYSVPELDMFIMRLGLRTKPRLLVIDEANKYVRPKPAPLPKGVAELNDFSRHHDIAWLAVCRRPTQFHSDVTELAHYVFAFRLPGRNDRRFFDDMGAGLGSVVATLKPYHFLVIEQGLGGDAFIHKPIPT